MSKSALISEHKNSEGKNLQKLLENVRLSDENPSALLRESGDYCPEKHQITY